LIEFHSDRAETYKNDRDSITAKMAATAELTKLSPTMGSIRDRIAEQQYQIASLQQDELLAESELDKHSRLLAVNRKLREEFPHAEPKAYLKEQKILAQAGL
jgi:hypothetical protein